MERIGEYLVKRLVGEGGMGKVYEAEERLSKRRVALKVLRPELTKSDDGRRLFLNEMRILAHLEHPNIVRSLASMEVDGQLVMALEFLDGRTLRDELTARGKLPWQEAVEITVRIAEALVVAHSQDPPIVHRDLKPENVMITGAGGATVGVDAGLKVMDFGIAKVLEVAHGTNTQSIGTLQYMSPEQIDARSIDARSDLYSLGLVLYEMLSGSPPFHSPSPRELLNMQCTQAPPPLTEDVRAGLPRGVEDILFESLEKDPDARPAGAHEVVDRLAPFRPAAPRVARTTTGLGRARATPTTALPAADGSGTADAAAPRTRGDTLHSGDTPMRAPSAAPKTPPLRADTVALVERVTAPREMSTGTAVLLIVALSMVAGLATYVFRVSGDGTSSPAATATATASAPAAESREPR